MLEKKTYLSIAKKLTIRVLLLNICKKKISPNSNRKCYKAHISQGLKPGKRMLLDINLICVFLLIDSGK